MVEVVPGGTRGGSTIHGRCSYLASHASRKSSSARYRIRIERHIATGTQWRIDRAGPATEGLPAAFPRTQGSCPRQFRIDGAESRADLPSDRGPAVSRPCRWPQTGEHRDAVERRDWTSIRTDAGQRRRAGDLQRPKVLRPVTCNLARPPVADQKLKVSSTARPLPTE